MSEQIDEWSDGPPHPTARASEQSDAKSDGTEAAQLDGKSGERPDGKSGERPDGEGVEESAVEHTRTRRWSSWLAGVLVLVGLGIAYGSPTVVATAVVPLTYVLYGAASGTPRLAGVRVERTVRDDRATPGDPVTVETTVHAPPDATLPDLRVLDGVPAELAVTDGTPRAATPLRPGGSVTVRYTLTAQRGEYGFDPVRLRARSTAGSAVGTTDVTAAGDQTLTCVPPGATVPVTRPAPRSAGTAPTDSGGEGLEFYSTREYRRGDPISRIDWRSYAKRGELVTTTYREERRARAVVVCDVRPPTRRSPAPGSPTGAGLTAYTAETAVAHLRAAGHEVGLVVLGLDPETVELAVPTVGDAVWLPQAGGTGGTAASRTRAVFDAASEAGRQRTRESVGAVGEPADGDRASAGQIAAAVPDGAHAVVVSPFTDATPLAYVRRLAVGGEEVTVVSPDATGDSLGGRTAGIDRQLRLSRAESACAAVIDWPADRSLALAVAQAVGPGSKGGRGG